MRVGHTQVSGVYGTHPVGYTPGRRSNVVQERTISLVRSKTKWWRLRLIYLWSKSIMWWRFAYLFIHAIWRHRSSPNCAARRTWARPGRI